MKITKQDIRLTATVGLAIFATGYVMAMFSNYPVVQQARRGLGG